MAENSKIEWCDHTFNPWIGCTKASEGCKHCYAETLMDKRYGRVKWGPQGTRVRTSAANWKKPLAWNKQTWRLCLECGFRGVVGPNEPFYLCRCGSRETAPTRQRVFCASLADVFEEQEELVAWRAELGRLVLETPNLDWLILTKRPENVFMMCAELGWVESVVPDEVSPYIPENVWLGVSVENQAAADERIPALLAIPARVRFLSMEPLLGPVEIGFGGCLPRDWKWVTNRELHWVIVGGESGPNARALLMPDFVRSIRDQCVGAGVPFFFKQWGEWMPLEGESCWDPYGAWKKVGKKKAGRLLDGREWNEFPQREVK